MCEDNECPECLRKQNMVLRKELKSAKDELRDTSERIKHVARRDVGQISKDLETVSIYLRDIMDTVDARMDDIFMILDKYDESTFASAEEAIRALKRTRSK